VHKRLHAGIRRVLRLGGSREGVKVVLKVLSTDKVVQIDALGLSQR
jgi:hypothetical protein